MVIENNSISGKLITPDMNYSGVYLIVNLLNNKFYVGSAKDLRHRMRNHFNDLKNKTHRNIHLQRSYNKNPNAFIMIMIEKVEREELLTIREQFWMDCLNVSDKTISYNILNTANSLLGFKHSAETRNKISQIQIGKTLSDEHKNNISKGLKGKTKGIPKNKPAHNRRRVTQFSKNGNTIKTWESITCVSESLNLNPSHIAACCRGRRKTHGGYIWSYSD